MYGSLRSAWPFRVRLCSVSVSELIDMRGSSGGRTVPKQCRSVAERYEFWWSVEPRVRQTPEAAELEVVGRPFENGVDGVLPHESPLLDVPGPHAARHAIFISIAAASTPRSGRSGFPDVLAAAAASVKAVGRADAAPRVGDGARRRAVRVRAAGGRGRARLAARRRAPAGGARLAARPAHAADGSAGRAGWWHDWRRR